MGTKGNEAADEAAKQGAENRNKNIKLVKTPIPGKTSKTELDKAIRNEWTRKWQSSAQYKHTKHFYSGPNKTCRRIYLTYQGRVSMRLSGVKTYMSRCRDPNFKSTPPTILLAVLCLPPVSSLTLLDYWLSLISRR